MKLDDYLQKRLENPAFKKEWDSIQPEMEAIRRKLNEQDSGNIFRDTMQGLLEAVVIDKGQIPVKEVGDMPAPTFRAETIENNLIDSVIN